MEKIILSDIAPLFMKKIGSGSYARVYKMPKQETIVKKYKRKMCALQCCLDGLEFANDPFLIENHVIVPKKAVYNRRGYLKGYTTDLIYGPTLKDLQKQSFIQDITYHEFLKAYYEALRNMEAIGEEGYRMSDTHEKNIIYDIKKKCFCFLDVDFWIQGEKEEQHTIKIMEKFQNSADPDGFKQKFKNQNIMYSEEVIDELFLTDEDKFKSIYDDPSINKTINIYKSEYLFEGGLAMSRFNGQIKLKDYDVLIPQETVFVDNIWSGYTTEPIAGFNLEMTKMCEKENIEKARKRAIANMEEISKMGFVLSKDFTEEDMKYDYNQNRFCFTNLTTIEHKKDTISIKEATIENVKRLQKILN